MRSDLSAFCHTKARQLVRWCFEPCQPQRILSGLKTNSSLSPSYLIYRSLNYKSSTTVLKYFTQEPIQHNPLYFMEHCSLSRKVKTILTISKCHSGNTLTHVLESILSSAGTQRRNLHQSSAMTSWVTHFILWTYTGTNGTFFTTGNQRIMDGYILTYSRL